MEIAMRTYGDQQNPDVLDLIRSLPLDPGCALDCGCGSGGNARVLSQTGWRVDGITINEAERT